MGFAATGIYKNISHIRLVETGFIIYRVDYKRRREICGTSRHNLGNASRYRCRLYCFQANISLIFRALLL